MENKRILAIITLLFLIGFFFRVYNLDKLLNFGYDQGRDAFIILRMILSKKPVLIGPELGLQGAFLGPFFYYLLTPFYLLGNWNPVVPAIWIAFLSALAIPAIYILAKKIFSSQRAGFFAAFLLTFSYGAIFFGRWLSNPSPYLLISTLFIFCLFKACEKKVGKWWLVGAALCLGLSLQTELANAIVLPVMGLLWIVFYRPKIKWQFWLLSILFFIVTISPLIVFDLRHDSLISQAVFGNLGDSQSHTSLEYTFEKRPAFYLGFLRWEIVPKAGEFGDYFIGGLFIWTLLLALWGIIKFKENKNLFFVAIWLVLPFIAGLFYTANYGNMFDYYFLGQLIPAFIIIGHFFKKASAIKLPFGITTIRQMLIAAILFLFAYYSFNEWKILVDPKIINHGINNKLAAADYVYQSALSDKYSVFTFVPNGQTESYDYLFWLTARKYDYPSHSTTEKNNEYFLLLEPDPYLEGKRFAKWYDDHFYGGELLARKEFGVVTIEHWLKSEESYEK